MSGRGKWMEFKTLPDTQKLIELFDNEQNQNRDLVLFLYFILTK